MAGKKEPTREDLRRAEREIGENIPRAMIGRDDGDVRQVETVEGADAADAAPATDAAGDEETASRH